MVYLLFLVCSVCVERSGVGERERMHYILTVEKYILLLHMGKRK